jgi:hypothetical protein
MSAPPTWSTVEVGLIAWAATCAGLTSTAAAWAEDEMPVMPPQHVTLQVVGIIGRGTDETVLDLDGSDLIPTTGGHRELVLQVAADSDSQVLGDSAPMLLEQFRSAATGPGSLAELEAMGLGMLGVGAPVTYQVRDAGGRAQSRAVVEVRLSFVGAATGVDVGFIETAELTGTVTRPDTTTITIPVIAP